MARLKYPFLYAWDRKLASNMEWSSYGQDLAEKHNAPLDALYFKTGEEVPEWTTYSSLERFEVKHEMWKRVTDMGYDAGPEPTEADFMETIAGRECTQSEADRVRTIAELIKEWIKHAGCGDPTCTSCLIGVAIGLEPVDEAYNAGFEAGRKSHGKSV